MKYNLKIIRLPLLMDLLPYPVTTPGLMTISRDSPTNQSRADVIFFQSDSLLVCVYVFEGGVYGDDPLGCHSNPP